MQTELDASLNVLGEPLKPCSFDPMTGFFRDGCCNTGPEDRGRHTVCVRVTAEFLAFSRAARQRPLDPAPGVRLRRPQPRRPLVPLRRRAGRKPSRPAPHPRSCSPAPTARSPRSRPARGPAGARHARPHPAPPLSRFSRCRARTLPIALRVQVSVRRRKSCSVRPGSGRNRSGVTANPSIRSSRKVRKSSRSSHQAASTQTGPK